MTVIELFAGAGGASLGLLRAGFTEVRAVEWDASACATRRAAGLRCDEGDVRDPKHYEGVTVDAVWSSFPCQAWSTAGKRLGKDDPRNGWPWTVDVLDQVKPHWFMAENVPGLTHHRGACNGRCADDCARLYFEQTILRELRERFEWVDYRILDAARFGVPQNRERLIIVAGPRPIQWPKETHAPPDELRAGSLFGETRKPWRTVREALGLGRTIWQGGVGGCGLPVDAAVRPAPSIVAKATATILEDPKHPHVRPDAPAPALRSGGAGHSAPPMWLNSSQTSGRKSGRAPCESSVDAPAPTVRANEGTGLTIRRDYTCPKPADGPRTVKDSVGKVLSFAPCNDACTICDHCGGHIDDHGRTAIMREDPSRGWEAHGIDEPSPTVRAGRPGGGLETRAASRPELLDKPSPTVTTCEVKGTRGEGQHGGPDRASDVAWLGAGIRRLTPAECAILQDFPPDHPWQGTKTSIYAQIGNAVPGHARLCGGDGGTGL